ncbi:MAG: SUMF1/EgtB/PvdO family nonheme iron enzyme [Deltaproteobacteria bacterium]|nr:SUMF1/EgtB/PvdO family nonheme iron enzyme [Deltaproteobacteria bacterium]
MAIRTTALTGLVLALTAPVHAESFATDGNTRQGRLRYVMTGASMVDNQGLQNGVNCLRPSASATIRPTDLSPRARLVAATLYVAGSLIADDGPDYANPAVNLFVTPGLRADDPSQVGAVEDAARAAADTSVELLLPGAPLPVTVSAPAGSSYVSVYYKPSGSEAGNVGFFVTPIDITQALQNDGRGVLVGDYTVSGLLADVCNGPEAVCNQPPSPPTCSTLAGAATHTNGAASFALLLIVEDPELPLHAVSVFEGLISLAGRTVERRLTLRSPISSPAVGSLTMYGLEGDLLIPDAVVNVGPCHAEEYVEADGDLDPSQNGRCLVDDDNPVGNIFNSTINMVPAASPPSCSLAGRPQNCCLGDGLCSVTGVDIDRFDISSALAPGASTVRVSVGSGTDRVALAVIVLGVDVFEPVLDVDSQIRVFEGQDGALLPVEGGGVHLGSTLTYSIAVSNTGNVAAHGVNVYVAAPPNTSGLGVVDSPPGSVVILSPTGGDAGTGAVTVSGFDVPAGEISEVRLQLGVPCPPNSARSLALTAELSCTDLPAFIVAAPVIEAGGPGILSCHGIDPDGPFAVQPEKRSLRGGGANCSVSGAPWLGLVAMSCGLLLMARGRRRRGVMWALLVSQLFAAGCGARHAAAEGAPPPDDRTITDLAGLPGEACGSGLMVYVARSDHSRYCIDRFEAEVGSGSLGDAMQGQDDTDTNTNGSTTAAATVGLGVTPAAQVSWYQAKALCENAGKHLCSRADWELACRGPLALIYPYGDTIDDHACNGFFNYPAMKPAMTGALDTCGSAVGAYDMSGNVEEWVADAVPRIPGTTALLDRAIRGGSFKSNSQALACVGDEFHAPPAETDIDRGFRCCSDGPVP